MITFAHNHRLQIQPVNRVRAQGARLPVFLAVIIQVLEHAGPAVYVTTFGDPRTDHATAYLRLVSGVEGLHADRALDLCRVNHIIPNLHDVSPPDAFISIIKVDETIGGSLPLLQLVTLILFKFFFLIIF